MINRKQLILPLDYSVVIADDDPVRKLLEICETLDFTKLYATYERISKKAHPITLFELVLFGYMCRRYSSREIEESCRTDIRCMWILQGSNIPDHSTIARFQNKKLAPIIEGLFYQLIEKLVELGEVGYENVFVDGTKIEANANKYTFVWAKSVKYYSEKLNVRIAKELPPIALRYGLEDDIEIEECLEHIKKLAITTKYAITKQQYRGESCKGCSHRQKCYTAKSENRDIVISQSFSRQRKESLENITSNEGILLRMNRSIQVEGVFGVLKQNYGFTRFLTKGKPKTETQFFILAMAFNIKKLCNRQKTGRFGKSLFEKEIA